MCGRPTAEASEACESQCDRSPIDVATVGADIRWHFKMSRLPVHMKTYKDAYSSHNAALLQVKPPMDDIYMTAHLPC